MESVCSILKDVTCISAVCYGILIGTTSCVILYVHTSYVKIVRCLHHMFRPPFVRTQASSHWNSVMIPALVHHGIFDGHYSGAW